MICSCARLKLKGEGHSKDFYFFVFAFNKSVNNQLFHSPKFQPLKSSLSWRNSSQNKLAAILKLSQWQPGRVYVMSFRRTQNWRQGEKPATDLASFTRSTLLSNFLSWWWLALPLVMISTPSRAIVMWGPFTLKSSSQISVPTQVSRVEMTPSPNGTVTCPVISAIIRGRKYSSVCFV